MDPQPRLQSDRSAPLRAADWTERRLYAFGGLAFDAVDLEEAVARVERAIRQRERLFVSTPNTNFLIATQKDAAFRRSVLLSDLVVPDGMPIVWMARLLGLPVKGRVTGADLYEQLVERANLPINVFFFGGPDGAAQEAMARLNARGTCVRGVGALSPGFGSMDSLSTPPVLDQINASNADLLVVALGAKRGQEWILRNLDRLNVPVVSHLGAVVNFAAGRVRRAPKWMGWAGIEWLWRIREEPGLWLRYADDGFALIKFCANQVIPDKVSMICAGILRNLILFPADTRSSVIIRCADHVVEECKDVGTGFTPTCRLMESVRFAANRREAIDIHLSHQKMLQPELLAWLQVFSELTVTCVYTPDRSIRRKLRLLGISAVQCVKSG